MMIELFIMYAAAAVILFGSIRYLRSRRAAQEAAGRPAREQLFSEAHPDAWYMVQTHLPRLHGYIIALVAVYLVLAELLRGNYLFMLDWYQASWVLPALVEITSSQASLEAWWAESGTFFLVCTVFIIMVAWTAYNMVWKVLFKDYYRIIYKDWDSRMVLTERKEGRLYWSTDNMPTCLWDRWYGSPPRTGHYIWIRYSWWPLFNPFDPSSSMTRIELSPEEAIEVRGSKRIYGHEKPIRKRVGIRQLVTTNEKFETKEVPLEQAKKEFDARTSTLVSVTRELSKGNAAIRLDKLRNVEIAEEEFAAAVEEVQQRGKRDQAKSGQ